MKIHQHVTLTADPIDLMDAATKQYVDNLVASITLGASGAVFFTNIAPTSTGNVGDKTYVAGTVPANKVITSGTTDTDNVTVTLVAEGGGTFYSPTITVTTTPALTGSPFTVALSEDGSDKRFFTGTIALTGVTSNVTLNAVSSTGATATTNIIRAVAGPTPDSLLIGALPGTQTEVKSGDIVPTASGRVPNSATYVEILAAGASGSVAVMSLGALDSGGTGFRTFSGNFTVGGGSGTQVITARARNSLGTYGSNFSSTNSVVLNQTYPTIGARTITYPAGQTALKGSETATVSSTITNANTYSYTSSANLSVASPTTYTINKSVTRVSGTYVNSGTNYFIAATKTSNAATTTASSLVVIADAAPTAAISIAGNPTRLFSSPSGTDYVVTIIASQTLSSAPSLSASSGTWQGAGWTGSGTTWTRTLRITDTDPKGPQTFSGLSLVNGALVAGSTITSGANYTVGGFASRIITFAAFERYHAIGTNIVDVTKVTASYTGSSTLTYHPDTGDYFQGFTIVDASGNFNPTGGYLFISDAAFAGSNTTGTLQLTIAEAM